MFLNGCIPPTVREGESPAQGNPREAYCHNEGFSYSYDQSTGEVLASGMCHFNTPLEFYPDGSLIIATIMAREGLADIRPAQLGLERPTKADFPSNMYDGQPAEVEVGQGYGKVRIADVGLAVPIMPDSGYLVKQLIEQNINLANNVGIRAEGWFVSYIHWTNHLYELGIRTSNIWAAREWCSDTIKTAEQVFYRPETNKLQEAYVFVKQVGDKLWYTMISAENGAPITTYPLNGDGSNDLERRIGKEALSLIDRAQIQGGTRRWLGNNLPSVPELVYWSIRYHFLVWLAEHPAAAQFAEYAAEVSKSRGNIMAAPALVIPSAYMLKFLNCLPDGCEETKL